MNSDTSNGGAYHPEAGSTSSSDRYAINKPSDVENGSIKVSDSKAEKATPLPSLSLRTQAMSWTSWWFTMKTVTRSTSRTRATGKFTFEMPQE